MIEAFPLTWPFSYPRCKSPQPGRFDTSFGQSRDAIVKEIKLLGGRDVVISTDIPLRNDGLPYANFSKPKDAGVAVYFTFQKEQVVFACDKWNRIEDNMQAVRKTIEAIRGLDRWGVSDMLKRAFTGFRALPEQTHTDTWFSVLDVAEDASISEIKEAYRKKAMQYHPDKGGDAKEFHKIKDAYEKAILNLQTT
jgi:hypothetical protein